MDEIARKRIFEFLLPIILVFVFCQVFVLPFWRPLFFAALSTILLYPLYQWFLRYCSEAWASAAVVVVATLGIALPILFGVYYLVDATTVYVSAISVESSAERQLLIDLFVWIDSWRLTKEPLFSEDTSFDQVVALLSEHLNKNLGSVAEVSQPILGTLYAGVANFLVGLAIMLVALFYMLISGISLAEFVEDMKPVRREFIHCAYEQFKEMTKVLLKVTIIIGAIQSMIGGAGLMYVGTPSPIMWMIVMFACSMLPVLGAAIVLGPACIIYYFVVGDTSAGHVVLGTLVLVSFIDNLLKPRIVGGDSSLQSHWVLLAVMGGMYSFGAIGMYAGPIIMALIIALLQQWKSMPSIDEVQKAKEWSPLTPGSRVSKGQ